MIEWPFEDSVTVAVRCSHLQGWSKGLQKVFNAINQFPIFGTVSPIVRIHRPRNCRMEMRVTSLTITPSDPLAKCLFCVSRIV